MPTGICRLCENQGELTYEHVPPRSAFNKLTKFRITPYLDYLKAPNPFEYQVKGKLHQGGIGFYSLCRSCNSFLGSKYVTTYTKYSNSFIDLAKRVENNHFVIIMENFQPVKVLKQIAAMFLSVNEDSFSRSNKDLREFVFNTESKELPPRFRFFNYLNSEGNFRHLPVQVKGSFNSGLTIVASEIAFPPLGHIMTINFDGSLPYHQEITHFKNFDLEQYASLELSIFRLPTYLPFLLDYRHRDTIVDNLKGA
ncbi:hypothetical protein SAMN05444008_106175 [Cnuella takakiae]|uniref:HNH endonuclease n=2 Tax=Cnuella takakiae TaxID=1302690 RepID=A0A1M5A9Z6_9BACT|nr:hypothetical protein SAMN05444008_106175 [Cnuella takakiae]